MSLYPHATLLRISQWAELFAGPDRRVAEAFQSVYGDDERLIARRIEFIRGVIAGAAQHLPHDLPSAIIRVPGRINTMGLHSDGQFSYKNHVVFGKEAVAVVQGCDDDTLFFASPHEQYPDHTARIGELLPPERRGTDWLDIIEAAPIVPGAWQNPMIGPILRLQSHFRDRQLRGLNVFLDGDIPIAAGVSSSSALATLAGIATIHFNRLELTLSEAVMLIGAGELYTGARGGPGDTGAQMICRQGHVAHVKYDMRFGPYELHQLPFPSDWRILLCNTLVTSRKAVESRETVRARGLAQGAGMVILRERFPDLLGNVRCLAHITPEDLGIRLSDVYEILKALPERASMDELRRMAPSRSDEMEYALRFWRTELAEFPVRAVCMYLICEPARGARNRQVLEARNEAELGRMMMAAHDGDRVVRWLNDTESVPYDTRVPDAALDRLARMADSDDAAEREAAALYRQPGSFECSCPELDLLVDILTTVDGVIGARITGGGLGGCMFAYVHKDAVNGALDALQRRYYGPRGLPLAAWELFPTEGGRPLTLPE